MSNIALNIDTYGGPIDNPDIEEKADLLREKILRDSQELTEILAEDLPKFLERQVKARFLDAFEFSDALDESQVKAIKDDVAATGQIAIDEIIPALKEDDIWLNAHAGDEKLLEDNEAVWAEVQKICGYLAELLGRHSFPPSEQPVDDSYRLPTWFVGGRLCKSIVESYWRNVEDYRVLQKAIHTRGANERKKKLLAKWDAAK